MNSQPALSFKIATQDSEFELIHRLNYKTFVEEIPQHNENTDQRLVDKFHSENTYAICLCGDHLVGMIAGRGSRPFSLDQKLAGLDSFLPPGRKPVEMRLLSVEKNYRNGQVFCGLVGLISRHFMDMGYDFALISGTTRQLKLYKKLGFVPFGPLVGTGEALFQPMYLTLETFEQRARAILRAPPASDAPSAPANFLPGPVAIHPDVRRVFSEEPVSHRSPAFVSDFKFTQQFLCELVQARSCQILLGSGSMANDAIAGQLALAGEPGIILSNGEFGDRLVDHARRFGLGFSVHEARWGETFDPAEVARALDRAGQVDWLWAAHCETSTGVLNDLPALKQICAERGIKLCLDCISSIGTVPVDLRGVYLASCVSGKGLGAFTGLSMVFHHHELSPARPNVPRYLDLRYYAANDGVPFSQSSNLVYALQAALKRLAWSQRYEEIRELSNWLGARLRERGYGIVAPDAHASPAVFTMALPADLSSQEIGKRLEEAGYLLSYGSEYLRKRNWLQICLMGQCSREQLAGVLGLLPKLTATDSAG